MNTVTNWGSRHGKRTRKFRGEKERGMRGAIKTRQPWHSATTVFARGSMKNFTLSINFSYILSTTP